MEEKLDFKKRDKALYLPKTEPSLVHVPAMHFLMVDGIGAPEGPSYQEGLEILYSIFFTIKMSKLKPQKIPGYVDCVLPPLEGLWDGAGYWLQENRQQWRWTSLLRQPDFVTPEIVAWAAADVKRKKPHLAVERARLDVYEEGLVVQVLHIGRYCDEARSMAKLEEFMAAQQLTDRYQQGFRHHEIYLSDPRRTAPEKLKTVLRCPVTKQEPAEKLLER